jgi:hypothetical protein
MQIIGFDIGIRNLAVCVSGHEEDGDTKVPKIYLWKKIDLGHNKRDVQGLTDVLINTLDEIFYDDTVVDTSKPIIVLIEQQMNAIMRILQSVINTYFKVVAKYNPTLDLKTVFISPGLKNKYIKSHDIEMTMASKATKYAQNKSNSVTFVKWFLRDVPDLLQVITSEKKQDDLADVLTQNMAYYASRPKST